MSNSRRTERVVNCFRLKKGRKGERESSGVNTDTPSWIIYSTGKQIVIKGFAGETDNI